MQSKFDVKFVTHRHTHGTAAGQPLVLYRIHLAFTESVVFDIQNCTIIGVLYMIYVARKHVI